MDNAKLTLPEVLERWKGYLPGKLPVDSVDQSIELLRGEALPDTPAEQEPDEDSSR